MQCIWSSKKFNWWISFRPVVLFGPLADVARQMLLAQFSMRFAEPEGDGGVIRLSSVDQIMASGKHCVLDISIESVSWR